VTDGDLAVKLHAVLLYRGGAVIEKVTDAVALSELQAAVTVTVAELVAVGVPEMAPVEELILKPAGKVAE
jgi:hypothetical protein